VCVILALIFFAGADWRLMNSWWNPSLPVLKCWGGSFISAELPCRILKYFTGSFHNCKHMKKCMSEVNWQGKWKVMQGREKETEFAVCEIRCGWGGTGIAHCYPRYPPRRALVLWLQCISERVSNSALCVNPHDVVSCALFTLAFFQCVSLGQGSVGQKLQRIVHQLREG